MSPLYLSAIILKWFCYTKVALLTLSALPKHRLPPKNRDAVSNVPPRHPDLSSDRVAGVQPKTASAQVSEVAPVPNVMFAASSAVEPNCVSADVDTVQLSLHSGDTPSNAADSSGSASSACESLAANSVDIPADMGDARDLRIHCASLPIALVSAPASVPTTGKDTRNCQRTSQKFLVPSVPLDNVKSGSADKSCCTRESLASAHQYFHFSDTYVQNRTQMSCLEASHSFVPSGTPSLENGTSTLKNQPECGGVEALSPHLFTTGKSAAVGTTLIHRENAELRKKKTLT